MMMLQKSVMVDLEALLRDSKEKECNILTENNIYLRKRYRCESIFHKVYG